MIKFIDSIGPQETRRWTRTEVRRREFVTIAKKLCAERGVEGLKLREIARQAGVSAPAIYNHFENLEDLTSAIVLEHLEGLAAIHQEAMGMAPRVGIEHVCRAHTQLFADEPGTARLIGADLQSAKGLPALGRIEQRFNEANAAEAEIMSRGYELGLFREVDTEAVTLTRISTTLTLLTMQGLGTENFDTRTVHETADFVTDLIGRVLEIGSRSS